MHHLDVRLAADGADRLLHRALHHLERGAAEERRRERDVHALLLDGHVSHHAEVDERDRRDLRIGDLGERVPDRGLGHHAAPGTERRTSVISSHSASSSGCSPRSTASTDGRPSRSRELVALLRLDEAERVRPQLLDRGLVARLPREAVRPHLRVHAVVRLLAVDLRGEAGDLRVRVGLQRLDPQLVGRLVEDAARDRPSPVGDEAELHERRAAIGRRLPVERELVGGRAEVACRELVQRPRVPDLVLRDRGERDVLLQHGRDPGPLRVAPAEDQLVVGDAISRCARSLTRLLQLGLDRVPVDAVVVPLELVRELGHRRDRVARDDPERDRLAAAAVLLARVHVREGRVGREHRARVLEGLALPLLSEDLVDHAARASMTSRIHAVSARVVRRKPSRSSVFGPWPVTTCLSSSQSGSV